MDPIVRELIGVISRSALEHNLVLTPAKVRALATDVAPAVIRLPYAPRHKQTPESQVDKTQLQLTTRERQVLMGIARGLTAEQIGFNLGLAKYTVKTYLANAYEVLGARNGCHAIAISLKYGILKPEDVVEV